MHLLDSFEVCTDELSLCRSVFAGLQRGMAGRRMSATLATLLTIGRVAHPQVQLLRDQVAHARRLQRQICLQLCDWRCKQLRVPIGSHLDILHNGGAHFQLAGG